MGVNMKKKIIKTLILALICMSTFVSTAFANIHSGWTYEYGSWRCINEDGTLIANSWLYDNGNWYYLDCYGRMCVGWHQDIMPSSMYYLNYSGTISRCEYGSIIPKKWYNFSNSGELIG